MWIYVQATGELLAPDGELAGVGYAGHGEGKNNPDLQQVAMVGPLPCGRYKRGKAFDHPKKGKVCMRLLPAPRTEMFGRDGMLCHGDSIAAPGTASNGCIIQSRTVRLRWSASLDEDLLVVRDRLSIPT